MLQNFLMASKIKTGGANNHHQSQIYTMTQKKAGVQNSRNVGLTMPEGAQGHMNTKNSFTSMSGGLSK